MIGAKETELRHGCECELYDYGIYEGSVIYMGEDDCDALEDPDTQCYDYYELGITQKLSDGFILAESAMDAPGINYQLQFMDGSNHMQLRNDSEMEKAVDAIFINGLDGEYFKTDEQ